MLGCRPINTPASAQSRRSRSPASNKRCPTANSTTGRLPNRSPLLQMLLGQNQTIQLDNLTNFRQIIAQKVSEDVSKFIWLKILLVGPQFSGKTSLIRLFCEGKYNPVYQPTVGVDYGFKIHHCQPQNFAPVDVRVNFWDCAGRQEYFQVRNELYTETDICLLVTDVSLNPTDQVPLLKAYRDEVDNYCRKQGNSKHHPPTDGEKDADWDEDIEAAQQAELTRINHQRRPFTLAVCANKCDMLRMGRMTDDPSLNQVKEFALNEGIKYFQTTCVTNDPKAVDTMFAELIETAAVKKLQQQQSDDFLRTGIIRVIQPD